MRFRGAVLRVWERDESETGDAGILPAAGDGGQVESGVTAHPPRQNYPPECSYRESRMSAPATGRGVRISSGAGTHHGT